MKTDPEQIQVAIRVNEAVNASRGSALITVSYQAEDGSIDEEHEFDVSLTKTQELTPALIKGLLPGEQVTVMSLSPEAASNMKDFQQRLFEYKKTGGDGSGSFGVNFGKFCLDSKLPNGRIPLTLFLKTDSTDDYIVFIKTDFRDLLSEIESGTERIPGCEEIEDQGL